MKRRTRLHLMMPSHIKVVTDLERLRVAKSGSGELDELQAGYIEVQGKNEELWTSLVASESSRDQYRSFYESSPVGFVTLSAEMIILNINPAGIRLFGTRRDNALKKSFEHFVSFWDAARFGRTFRRQLKTPKGCTFDLALQCETGGIVEVQVNCIRLLAPDGTLNMQLTLIDITGRKKAEAEIKQLAFYDPLTTLPNRRLLLDRLQYAMIRSARTMRHGAVLYVDIDDFKTLNDQYGHGLGDLLLQQVARRMVDSVRAGDTVARLGGDEFVVVLQDLDKELVVAHRQAKRLGEKLLLALRKPYLLAGHQHRTTASIGINLFFDDEFPIETLLKRADLALYSVKVSGRNSVGFFEPEMEATVVKRGILDADIRLGLKDKDFVLHYQPQVDRAGRLTSVEALLRWQHPQRGLLLPGDFVPYAEEKGLIGLLGQQVAETVCRQLKKWSAMPAMAHLKIAMNVSAIEFCHPEFVGRLLSVIDRTGADPCKLVLEFTERVMFSSMDETLEKMNVLRMRGISFSLDDFGIGYSSLSYLHSLPLDQLKIDRTFVRRVGINKNDSAIARSIIALGQSLGVEVLAEGVETQEQVEFLSSHGCSTYQGYLFGQPAPIDQLMRTCIA